MGQGHIHSAGQGFGIDVSGKLTAMMPELSLGQGSIFFTRQATALGHGR